MKNINKLFLSLIIVGLVLSIYRKVSEKVVTLSEAKSLLPFGQRFFTLAGFRMTRI